VSLGAAAGAAEGRTRVEQQLAVRGRVRDGEEHGLLAGAAAQDVEQRQRDGEARVLPQVGLRPWPSPSPRQPPESAPAVHRQTGRLLGLC